MPEKWDDEDESSSEEEAPRPAIAAGGARRKFDDEEEDSDVLEAWDEAEDSEVEREKAKVAAEKKAKADAEAAANKKSKAQRIAEKSAANKARLAAGSDEESEESEGERRERLRRTEQEADLKHAEDLFGGVGGVPNTRVATTKASAVVVDQSDPTKTIDITNLALFDPKTKTQFELLKDTMIPVIGKNSTKAHYTIFLQDFVKQLSKELPSDQIKKIASTLTALSNEKMKEEKAAVGGKKSKAQKTKVALNANRNVASTADTAAYDGDDFGDDDFM